MKAENNLICSFISNGKLEIEKIVREYSNYVYTIIQNSGYNMKNEDIEEIISDVFFTLWNNQYKLDTEKRLSSYIAGITKNLMRKKYREKRYESINDFEEKLVISENFEIILEENEQNALILRTLEKMNIEDQKIFMYFYFEQRSIKEIAKILSISESKVKMKLHRTRKKLKRKLNEEEV